MKQASFASFAMVLLLACMLAWLTHIVVTIGAANWGLLIAGAIFFPIGIVHGAGTWLGVW